MGYQIGQSTKLHIIIEYFISLYFKIDIRYSLKTKI